MKYIRQAGVASNLRSYKMSATPTTPCTPKADLEFTNLNGQISILDLKGNPNNMVPTQEAANSSVWSAPYNSPIRTAKLAT